MIRTARLVLPALFTLTVVITPTPAWAATCGLSGSTLSLFASLGQTIEVKRDGSNLVVTGATCTGATPTVTTVDLVSMSGGGTAVVDLSGGAFAPGLTAEGTGESEIELGGDSSVTLVIRGGSGRDEFSRISCAVDLNFDGDVELTAFGPSLTLDGGPGDDILSDLGGDFCTARGSLVGGE